MGWPRIRFRTGMTYEQFASRANTTPPEEIRVAWRKFTKQAAEGALAPELNDIVEPCGWVYLPHDFHLVYLPHKFRDDEFRAMLFKNYPGLTGIDPMKAEIGMIGLVDLNDQQVYCSYWDRFYTVRYVIAHYRYDGDLTDAERDALFECALDNMESDVDVAVHALEQAMSVPKATHRLGPVSEILDEFDPAEFLRRDGTVAEWEVVEAVINRVIGDCLYNFVE